MAIVNKPILIMFSFLLLCGCNNASNSTPSAEATAALVASATPAASPRSTPAVNIDPVLVGDKMVFTDPTYKFKLSFSPDYFFNANPEAMSATLKAGQELVGADFGEAQVALRLTLTMEPPGSRPVISALVVLVERVSPLAGSLTNKQFNTISRTHVDKNPMMKLLGSTDKVMINNTEFYKTVYELRSPGTDRVLTNTAYNHYDPQTRLAYTLSYSQTEDSPADEKEKWEEIVRSFKVENKDT